VSSATVSGLRRRGPEVEKGMHQVDGFRSCSCVTASPNRCRLVRDGESQPFCLTMIATQVSIDPVSRGVVVSRYQVAGHERDQVRGCVPSCPKAIDALNALFPAQVPVVSGDPFTFDDGVRIVHPVLFSNILEQNRNVGYAISLGR